MIILFRKLGIAAVLASQFVLATSGESRGAELVSDADLSRVCRATIAAIMGRDVAIIKTTSVSDGIAKNEYRRPNDNSLWKNQCKVSGNRVIWAGIDVDGPGSGPGRWQDDPRDEVITYELSSNSVRIIETFSDGSTIPTDVEVK